MPLKDLQDTKIQWHLDFCNLQQSRREHKLTRPYRVCHLQALGRVPTISINKTDGCQVYLSKDSLDCDIVSAKSSEMNILVPHGDDEYVSGKKIRVSEPYSSSCFTSCAPGCSTEGVPSTWAVQNSVERLQTGDGTHWDRRLTDASTPKQQLFVFAQPQSQFPMTEMCFGWYPAGSGTFWSFRSICHFCIFFVFNVSLAFWPSVTD